MGFSSLPRENTKLDRFSAKNQQAQRKLLYFFNRRSAKLQKMQKPVFFLANNIILGLYIFVIDIFYNFNLVSEKLMSNF